MILCCTCMENPLSGMTMNKRQLFLQYNEKKKKKKEELTTMTMNMYSVSVHGMYFPTFTPVHAHCL